MSVGQAGRKAHSPPPLDEAARRIGTAGRALGQELWAALLALLALVRADLALSRSAVVRALLFGGSALVLALSAWLWLMLLSVVALQTLFELPLWAALGILVLTLLLATGLCLWRAWRAMEDARFAATRRQLARLRLALQSEAAASAAASQTESAP